MASTETTQMLDVIRGAIEKELRAMIETRYESMKKEFIEQIDRDKAADLAGMTLHIMKSVEMETAGPIITIRLKTETKS